MTAGRLEALLWMLALALVLTTGTRARFGDLGSAESSSWIAAPQPMQRVAPESLAKASGIIVDRDLFRLERRPSSAAYAPAADAPPPSPRPARPALLVTGIVGGPPWEALIEGLPGRAGSVVVRRGDVFGDSVVRLTVKRIGPDTVIVVGMDTTWTLTVRKAWE